MKTCATCPEDNLNKFYTNLNGKSFKHCMRCHSRNERERYYAKRSAMWAAEGKTYQPGSCKRLNKGKDMNNHNLIYIRKEDKKIVHMMRIDNGSYSVKDPITGEKEKITAHFVRKKYECVSKFSKLARKKKLDYFGCVRSLQTQEKQLA